MIRHSQRVYGILINDRQEVLVSDEFRFGIYFRKFPGGGIEKKEGIIDALKREFEEELNASILSYEFLFFNDYFQQSAFDPEVQVTCFYYIVTCNEIDRLGLKKYDLPLTKDGECQKWISLETLKDSDLSFPIDQHALRCLKKKLNIIF